MDPTSKLNEKDEITNPVDKVSQDKLTYQINTLSLENRQNNTLQNANVKVANPNKDSSPLKNNATTTKSTPQTPNKNNTNSKSSTNSDSKVNKTNKNSSKGSPKSTEEKKERTHKSSEITKDTENNQKVDAQKYPNLAFYRNQIKSKPNGVFLEVMHNKW